MDRNGDEVRDNHTMNILWYINLSVWHGILLIYMKTVAIIMLFEIIYNQFYKSKETYLRDAQIYREEFIWCSLGKYKLQNYQLQCDYLYVKLYGYG